MTYNSDYAMHEFNEHGEIWLQQRLAGKLNTVFDVGANVGEWTKMCRRFQPQAEIHAFEVVPDTYRKFLNNVTIDASIIPNGFGLSDENGAIPVKHKSGYDSMSSCVTELNLDDSELRTGLVIKGDDYIESRNINKVDFLKIDVEGFEGKVFKGFENSLKSGKIKVIQFEYSFVCIITKWLLLDSYKFLEPLGFKLGKLHKDHIVFHDYTLVDEDFKGPEYVAVHRSVFPEFGLT